MGAILMVNIYDGAVERLESLKDDLNALDPDKSFSKYIALRELAFCFIPNVVKDKYEFQELVFEVGKFLADAMVVDKALLYNLYHYIAVRMDDQIPEHHKTFLLQNLDAYIKPRENKSNLDIDRFSAGFLVYQLSYENDFSSKDEARSIAAVLFKLSETEIRNCTKQFEQSYQEHLAKPSLMSWYKLSFAYAIFFHRMNEVLGDRKDTWESFSEKYQKLSSKQVETTKKTCEAYLKLRALSFDRLKPFIERNEELMGHMPQLSVYYLSCQNKQGYNLTEDELTFAGVFVNQDKLKDHFRDTL